MEGRRRERSRTISTATASRATFPIDWLPGSDALTAYLVQIADDAGREWPEESLARMLSGLEAFATGRIVRGSALPTADLTVRKLAAIEALSRHDRAKAGDARHDHHRSRAVAHFGADRLDRHPEARGEACRGATSA